MPPVHVYQRIVSTMYGSTMCCYIPRVLSPALISVDVVGLVSNGNSVAAAPENGWLLSCCAGDNNYMCVHVLYVCASNQLRLIHNMMLAPQVS